MLARLQNNATIMLLANYTFLWLKLINYLLGGKREPRSAACQHTLCRLCQTSMADGSSGGAPRPCQELQVKCRVWARLAYPIYEVKVTTQLTLDGVKLRQGELLQLAVATQEGRSRGATKHVKVPLELLQFAFCFLPLLLCQLPLCFGRFCLFFCFTGVFLTSFPRLQTKQCFNPLWNTSA